MLAAACGEQAVPAALGDGIADELANPPFAWLQAPAEAHAPLGEEVHPVAARQQLGGRLHGRLLQAQAPLDWQRLAIQEELAACMPALRRSREPTSMSVCSPVCMHTVYSMVGLPVSSLRGAMC